MKKSNTFFRLLRYMFKYKGLTFIALSFILLTTLVATAIPLLAQYYIDNYITKNIGTAGLYILAGYYGLFILRVVFTFIGEYYFSKVAHSIVRDLREESFSNLQKLGMSYFDKTPVGSIVSRLTSRYVWNNIFKFLKFGINVCSNTNSNGIFKLAINYTNDFIYTDNVRFCIFISKTF